VRRQVVTRAAALAAAFAVVTACGSPEPIDRAGPPVDTRGLVWAADLDTDGLSRFRDTPYNTVVADVPTVVPVPERREQYALKTSIPAGATTDDYGARSEVVPDVPDFAPGDDYYFSASMWLDPAFPVNESWQVVWQWKAQIDGSPPLEMDVEDGRFMLAGGDGHPDEPRPFSQDLGPAVPGQWTDWVVRVVFSDDPEVGLIEIWRDGVKVLEPLHPPGGTMYADSDDASSYVKYGYYRRSGIGEAGTILYDNLRIGTRYEAVAGSG
jgi:hypothetical protein